MTYQNAGGFPQCSPVERLHKFREASLRVMQQGRPFFKVFGVWLVCRKHQWFGVVKGTLQVLFCGAVSHYEPLMLA